MGCWFLFYWVLFKEKKCYLKRCTSSIVLVPIRKEWVNYVSFHVMAKNDAGQSYTPHLGLMFPSVDSGYVVLLTLYEFLNFYLFLSPTLGMFVIITINRG